VIDQKHHVACYGVGGGIVWDSVPDDEYAECQTKTKVLSGVPQDFEILETLLWEREGGYFLLGPHIQRAICSAQYFGISLEQSEMQTSLENAIQHYKGDRCRVRWLLSQDGSMRVELHAMGESAPVKRVGLALDACNSQDPFLYHKTTHRAVYEQARLQCPEADDVLLVNERGEVTESTIANLVIATGDMRVTPSVSSGLLPGTFREELIKSNQISEGVVTVHDIKQADSIYLINSVRQWMPVEFLDRTI
jgi:para-aminobenzoate synthetase/4-amino-4-deoxychorismate lyase